MWRFHFACLKAYTLQKRGLFQYLLPFAFFYIRGAIPPLRPRPFGMLAVTNLVRLGIFFDFLYHSTKRFKSLHFSAAATECEHMQSDCQFGQSLSQQYCPLFFTVIWWGRVWEVDFTRKPVLPGAWTIARWSFKSSAAFLQMASNTYSWMTTWLQKELTDTDREPSSVLAGSFKVEGILQPPIKGNCWTVCWWTSSEVWRLD